MAKRKEELPKPLSRIEQHLSYINKRDISLSNLPKPLSRIEEYLEYIAYNMMEGGNINSEVVERLRTEVDKLNENIIIGEIIEQNLLLNADFSERKLMNSSGVLIDSDTYNNYIGYLEAGTYILSPKTRNVFVFTEYPSGKACDKTISNKTTTTDLKFTLEKPYYVGINYFIDGSTPKLIKELNIEEKESVKIPKLKVDMKNLSTELLELLKLNTVNDLEVTKEGETFFIRSEFDSKRDIVAEVSRSGSHNGSFNFVKTILIDKNEKDLSKGVIAVTNGDDITPIRTFTTVGANHGYTSVYEVSCTHDKTTEDLGSEWTGSDTATLTLLKVESGKLTFATNYSEADGVVTANVLGTMNNVLTHINGATNQTDITVTSNKAIQLYPSINNIKCNFILDGKEIVEDGIYFGKELRVKEQYNIMCYKELIDLAHRNIGVHFTKLNIPTAVRMKIDYLYTKGCNCFISHTLTTLKKITFCNCGFIQSIVIAGNGKNVYRYLPNVKAKSGIDFGTLYDMANYKTDLKLFTSDFIEPTIPPNRCVDWVGSDRENKDYGFVMGYIVDKTDASNSERVKNGGGWDLRRTKKSYPVALTQLTLGPGISKTFSCYRNWISGEKVEDASLFNIVKDKKDTYVYIDYHKDVKFKNFALDEYLGRNIEIVESKNFTLHNDTVNADGVLFSINNNYGYAILKLI